MDEERIERACEARLAWWRGRMWHTENEALRVRLCEEYVRAFGDCSPAERDEVTARTERRVEEYFLREGKSPESLR